MLYIDPNDCLDCEACFEIGAPACFACGGDTWAPLAKFLDQGPLRVLPQFHSLPRSWKSCRKVCASHTRTAPPSDAVASRGGLRGGERSARRWLLGQGALAIGLQTGFHFPW